jgi:hypothetical protein
MIYGIAELTNISPTQMHIYLKNHTGNDGGNLPEIFYDMAKIESVNGLYTFAIACLLTDNFQKSSPMLSGYSTDELNVLAFTQYVKGLATTIQPNKKIENKRYDTLKSMNLLGLSPSLLNLDGERFGVNHYDTEKYTSREDADHMEDSFPYWVINIVKEIETATEIEDPSTTTDFKPPYIIQNQSDKTVDIYGSDLKTVIGHMAPSSTECAKKEISGYYQLASAKMAFVKVAENIIPIKHVLEGEEVVAPKNFKKQVTKLPDHPFDVIVKEGKTIKPKFGVTENYLESGNEYKAEDIIHIEDVFEEIYGVTEKSEYILLDVFTVSVYPSELMIKKNKKDSEVIEKTLNTIDEMDPEEDDTSSPEFPSFVTTNPWVLIIAVASYKKTTDAIALLKEKGFNYPNQYIDVSGNENYSIVLGGFQKQQDAIKHRKRIVAMTGLRAIVMESKKFMAF